MVLSALIRRQVMGGRAGSALTAGRDRKPLGDGAMGSRRQGGKVKAPPRTKPDGTDLGGPHETLH